MNKMSDPYVGLVSFQKALSEQSIAPEPCSLYPEISFFHDEPDGEHRLTYALIDKGIVKATVIYLIADPVDGIPCFGVGYAVAEPFRKQGLVGEVLKKTIAEMKNGFKGKIPEFYIEAIVDKLNIASQKVAAKYISSYPESVTDKHSKKPAFQYMKFVNNS